MLEFNATFLIAMISFIIFMIIMNAVLYKPLARISGEREKLISKNYEDASITDKKNETLKKQYESCIEKSRILAKENFTKKLSGYRIRKENIITSAKNIAKRDLAILNAELNGDEREAKLLLKNKIVNLANCAASKILGFETTIEAPDDIVF